MASRPEAGVAVRIELVLLLALVRTAAADPEVSTDAQILGRDPGWQVEDVQLRTSYIDQRGHGYQSQDGPPQGPGSEAMYIIEPVALITIRQSANVVHEITIPVDIITAASPDAVDTTTSASRRNEAVDLDVRSTFKQSDTDTVTTRLVAHYEEPLSSGLIGAGWKRSVADDNATVAVSANLSLDGFDNHDQFGDYLGKTLRTAFNLNASMSQLLSPTTVFDAGYGGTFEHGTLTNGWNAVPIDGLHPAGDFVPRDRTRHALSARIAQHIPQTHSTLKLWYRFYADDWGLYAHSIELDAYQYVLPWLYIRGGYRFHHQNAVSFFTTGLEPPVDRDFLRTSDSDLSRFDANEWSVQLATVRKRNRPWSFSAEVMRYVRTNDLQITAISLTLGKLL
jgi:hypothetical protein